jgi:hypothetical protein
VVVATVVVEDTTVVAKKDFFSVCFMGKEDWMGGS